MRVSSLALVVLAGALLAPAAWTQEMSGGRSIPGFDPTILDTTTSPCVDFYQFACGGWLARTSIPPDQSHWGRFQELAERNREVLRDILEQAAAPQSKRDDPTRKLGDYYGACMDEKAIEAAGLGPLRSELARLEGVRGRDELFSEMAHLHLIGVSVPFQFNSDQDFKDATRMIAAADQGGLGLPDRDYYLKKDMRSMELRALYATHVRRMFSLLGDDEVRTAADADAVMALETALAESSQDRVSRRNPANLDHKMTLAQLRALAPDFPWDRFFSEVDAPRFAELNVASPDFFKRLDVLLNQTPVQDWKTYLRWHLVHAYAPLLSKAFVAEHFDFYERRLTGAQEQRPRWKRCVELADRDLGEALGRLYVEKKFGPRSKEGMRVLLRSLERAFQADIADLSWMTPATRTAARRKLSAIANKIGYPDRWRDYSALLVERGDALGNAMRGRAFEARRRLVMVGRRVDRKEWDMTSPTVNAYYDPQRNDINFPAGILQPPFYDPALDLAVNLGGIGAVIGHEMTHGFDDEGRHFDARGDLRDWWTADDAREFEWRANCIANEYGAFVATEDVKLNGRLTLGENTADNGGLRIAYMALESALAAAPQAPIDHFTPEQRLFMAYGQIWCEKRTTESLRLMALTNPHSPNRYRVNGVVVNTPEFARAFSCEQNSPMVNVGGACRVW